MALLGELSIKGQEGLNREAAQRRAQDLQQEEMAQNQLQRTRASDLAQDNLAISQAANTREQALFDQQQQWQDAGSQISTATQYLRGVDPSNPESFNIAVERMIQEDNGIDGEDVKRLGLTPDNYQDTILDLMELHKSEGINRGYIKPGKAAEPTKWERQVIGNEVYQVNPYTGEKRLLGQAPVSSSGDDRTASQKELNTLNRLEGELVQARQSGDQASIERAEKRLNNFNKILFKGKENVNLSAADNKELIRYQNKAEAAANSAANFESLANRYESADYTQGLFGTAVEKVKEFVGGEDKVSALKNDYNRTFVKSVLDNLPPGTASDSDVALAMKGWPGASANPEYMASFLRGVAKVKVAQKEMDDFSASYISNNGTRGLTAARNKYIDELKQRNESNKSGNQIEVPLDTSNTPESTPGVTRRTPKGSGNSVSLEQKYNIPPRR